jgi:hypothetical protein
MPEMGARIGRMIAFTLIGNLLCYLAITEEDHFPVSVSTPYTPRCDNYPLSFNFLWGYLSLEANSGLHTAKFGIALGLVGTLLPRLRYARRATF